MPPHASKLCSPLVLLFGTKWEPDASWGAGLGDHGSPSQDAKDSCWAPKTLNPRHLRPTKTWPFLFVSPFWMERDTTGKPNFEGPLCLRQGWTKFISHHFETMVETMVCDGFWAFTAESCYCVGFLNGFRNHPQHTIQFKDDSPFIKQSPTQPNGSKMVAHPNWVHLKQNPTVQKETSPNGPQRRPWAPRGLRARRRWGGSSLEVAVSTFESSSFR